MEYVVNDNWMSFIKVLISSDKLRWLELDIKDSKTVNFVIMLIMLITFGRRISFLYSIILIFLMLCKLDYHNDTRKMTNATYKIINNNSVCHSCHEFEE